MKSQSEPTKAAAPNESATGWNVNAGAAVLIGVSVLGVLMLAAVKRPAVPPPVPIDHSEILVEPAAHAVVVAADTQPSSAKGPVPLRATPVVDAQPVAADVTPSPAVIHPHVTVETGTTAVIEEADRQVEAASEAVTVTGCLERDDDSFRLTNTSGDDAPKARSWKSGFLRKRPASIALVDPANRVAASYVGSRVAATGTLEDREMHVVSLIRLGQACKG